MIFDFKDYGKRIKAELLKENKEKYQYVSEDAIANHIRHIGWCVTQIVFTHNDDLETPYFYLRRGFKKFFNPKFELPRYQKRLEQELRLDKRPK